ncbi:MAG: helix-turn-helix domain-containing protein [Zhongshania sp.]|jgi:putative transcriptional regulator|uniref:helix-turn-helix domain-containing protein n=1 Tax=Zhongshania sp. TaxID=1971902 RepID=UPI002637B321|nr:type II toxin-antitoxin system MqsA family antitoxin [Zhongshania sp.]MDF1693664.1 helix-turn-helix domain-containing protein [Zhongshania sp.]
MANDKFTELVESVEWMIAHKKGLNPEGATVTQVTAVDVKALRNKLGLSQVKLAKVLNVSGDTVKNWEQGRRNVPGTAVRLMQIVERHPEIVAEELRA